MRIFLVVALLIFSLEAKSLFSNDEQANNAKYIGALKDLMIATQKTRGLTNSYMNGNKSALLLIHSNKRDMKKAIGTMESLPLASHSTIGSSANNISQALTKLGNVAFDQKADQTFKDYTGQVDQILMLAQSISKQGSKDLNPFGKEASAIMMETILPLAEQIGKMRGMGSGIVAKQSITDTQKFAMTAMLSEISSLESRLQSDMRNVLSKHKDLYGSSIKRELSNVDKAISEYVDLTNKKVLNSAKSDCVSTDYFNHGTDIISTLVNIFNSNNKAIMADSKGWI
ncbi:MAG: nitrate- and nitrite sensing domain-containing protein [Campylobacterota bacterium]|nr:nitrate- and nitrite sensing domain-containing protein [Campylobacterota bacterium]